MHQVKLTNNYVYLYINIIIFLTENQHLIRTRSVSCWMFSLHNKTHLYTSLTINSSKGKFVSSLTHLDISIFNPATFCQNKFSIIWTLALTGPTLS